MKRQHEIDALLASTSDYISTRDPLLEGAPLRLRRLDGPPDAPRYSVDADRCCAAACPYGTSVADAAAGRCHVLDCSLRHAMRLLLAGDGRVLHEQRSTIKWS